MNFNTDAFLKELGEQEVTAQTFNEARYEDDSEDEPDEMAAPEEQEEQEDRKSDPQPPVDDPAPAPQEDKLTAEDYQRIFAEQSRQTMNQLQNFVEQRLQPQQQQQQFEDPMIRLHREVEELKQKAEASNARAKMAVESFSKQKFESAVSELSKRYGDLNEFIPRDRMDAAFKQAMQHEAYNVDWEGEIAKTYKLLSHDKYFSASSKSEDELSKKRAEKREKSGTAAISSGGAAFQQPSKKLDRNSPTYDMDKKAAFMADLKALGG